MFNWIRAILACLIHASRKLASLKAVRRNKYRLKKRSKWSLDKMIERYGEISVGCQVRLLTSDVRDPPGDDGEH